MKVHLRTLSIFAKLSARTSYPVPDRQSQKPPTGDPLTQFDPNFIIPAYFPREVSHES